MIPKPDIPIVSLFSGAGGMDLGFRKAGFLPLLALDSSRAAVDTYNWNNANEIARQCDLSALSSQKLAAMVREVSPDRAPRGVIGGPPCQSFSRGNRGRKWRDPRARLGLVYAHLVRALNEEFGVDFIVLENVVGLRSARHSHRFETIQRALRLAGFSLFVRDLEASNFGVPQHRRRLLVVGVNRDKFPWVKFEFPQGTGKPPTVRQMIVKLPEPTFFQRGLKPEAIAFHPNHWTMNPLSPKFRTGMHGNGRSFKKLAWNRPSFTVAYGNREIHIHPRGRRRLSVFEAMLLQGFPRKYEIRGTLSDQVTQVSDAVPPALAEAVASAIKQSIYVPIKQLQNSLLRWFENNERPFPWRRTRNTYRVLVAEKLLQQTAATDAVVKAFREIVRRYPSWSALADAQPGHLKTIVAPLGFAYRASELVRLARAIVRCHAGQAPHDLKSLLALPGVGDYCARAVMSFALRQSFAVVDTNVARFLVRYFGLDFRLSPNPARDRKLQHIADALVPVNCSRDFNFAVLDLCAAHCKAKQPECQRCPVRKNCAHWNATLKSG